MRFLILLLLLPGCASTGSSGGSQLAGKWFGQSSGQEEARCWLSHRRPDGTYELTFVVDSPSTPRRHVEEGLWLHSNGMYATIAQKIDGKSVDLRERHFREFFRVDLIDDRQFVYTELATGAQFRVGKVPDSFVLGNRCPAAA